jgi:pyrimidine-specific ribonucleoside hydrolase
MGETSDDERDIDATRLALAAHADRYPDLGLGPIGDALRAGGEFPPSLHNAPTIVDTDVGGDPDDAVALLAAVRHVPHLALVTTCDEHHGQRARLARHLLDTLGRSDVPVVAGTSLAGTSHYCATGLVPAYVPAQPTGLLDAVSAVADTTTGPVRWIGLGPLTNLAAVLSARPDLAQRLVVTQMGGALNYRDPTRAEHNIRRDPAAARAVLGSAASLRLVTSDVTFTPRIEITADSPVYQALAAPDAPAWSRLLAAHMHAWFTTAHPGTMQHDPLTVTAALQLPFADFAVERITLDAAGRMHPDPHGTPVMLSVGANYDAFWRWLTTTVLATTDQPRHR